LELEWTVVYGGPDWTRVDRVLEWAVDWIVNFSDPWKVDWIGSVD